MALLVSGFFWTKKVLRSLETTSIQQLGPEASGTDATHAVEANDDASFKAADLQASESTSAARPSSDQSTSQTAPNAQTNSAKAATLDASSATRPPLSDEQLAELMDRHDCKNVPRTTARLANDLTYFELASEKWSEAMLAAYNDDLATKPNSADSSIQSVSTLMQRCVSFAERQAAKTEGTPNLPPVDWSEYPEWAAKVDVYDAKQVEKLIAAGHIKFLLERARQYLNSFTAVPGARGDLAYRDYRALQLLRVPLSKNDQAGLDLLQQLLRAEIVARAEQDAMQLVQQIKSVR